MSSSMQRELKTLVDQTLKNLETKSLKYTRVSVKDSNQGFEISIKVYLEHPMHFRSIYELTRTVTSKYGITIDDVMIYAPHSRAIRISFTIKRK